MSLPSLNAPTAPGRTSEDTTQAWDLENLQQSDLEPAPPTPDNPGKQRLIRRVITPALRWWLNTQLDQAQTLDIQLQAQDQQLFTGYLPLVRVLAAGVVYQGLSLTQAQLQAENIRVNLGQVLRGKPLKLLEPIQAWGELHLSHTDLQQSLNSDLLRGALRDLVGILAQELDVALPETTTTYAVTQADVRFGYGELSCDLELSTQAGTSCFSLRFTAELGLAGPQILEFRQLQGLTPQAQTLQINLGDGVHLAELTLTPDKLVCQGGIKIFP